MVERNFFQSFILKYLNFKLKYNFSSKKGISAVVAIALLLVVTVVAVVGFQGWFQTYQSSLFTQVEQKDLSDNFKIQTIIGGIFYLLGPAEIISVKVNGNDCYLSGLIDSGINSLPISDCAKSGVNEVVIVTKKGVYTKTLFLNNYQYSNPCPQGYIIVPGNIELGTKNFCVMKYEAKFADLTSKVQDATYNGWRYDASGGDMTVTSTPTPEPIVKVNQIQARNACEDLGEGYHLITNAEWTTIARNAENNAVNWDSGTIGSGSMFRGHTDGTPNYALSVYNISNYWDQTGQITPSIEKRVLVLNNLEIIWDLGGNVWEWNNDTCTQGDPWYNTEGSGWIEWTNVNVNGQEKTLAGPSGAYTSTNSVGEYFGCTSNGNGFRRGGRWYDGENAGAFALYLYRPPLGSNMGLGFRCSFIE